VYCGFLAQVLVRNIVKNIAIELETLSRVSILGSEVGYPGRNFPGFSLTPSRQMFGEVKVVPVRN
jgi:hypothetical protein